MAVVIQKHRKHPVYKFYDESKKYLGIVLGSSNDTVAQLAKDIAVVLKGGTKSGVNKEVLADTSWNLTNDSDKRIGGFEKDFSDIGDAIDAQIE